MSSSEPLLVKLNTAEVSVPVPPLPVKFSISVDMPLSGFYNSICEPPEVQS
jgi:hypothetical protein